MLGDEVPWLLLLGSPRSGTTFLLHVLESFDHVDGVAGQVFPSQIGPIVASTALDPEVRAALAFSFRSSLADFARLQQRVRSRAVGEALRRNVGLQELVEGLRETRHLRAAVFKEPFLSFAPEFVREALPAARVLVIHRDGRDVARSLVKTYGVLSDERLRNASSNEVVLGRPHDGLVVPWWVAEGDEDQFLRSTPYVRSIWMWREMVRRLLAFEEREAANGGADLLTVRYEDLVAAPQEVGQRIATWSGLPMNRRVRARLGEARTTSVGAHRGDPSDLAQAEKVAGAELARLGYL